MRVDLFLRPGGLTRCIMRAGPEKQLKPCRLLERKNKGQLAGTVCLYGSRQHSHISHSPMLFPRPCSRKFPKFHQWDRGNQSAQH